MSTTVNLHSIVRINAESREHDGLKWLTLDFFDNDGGRFILSVFTYCPEIMAAGDRIAEAVNRKVAVPGETNQLEAAE